MYLDRGRLTVQLLGRGFAWLDTGTHSNLLEAANFIEAVEKRQGFKIACLEEIAWHNRWLDTDELRNAGRRLGKTDYGKYLQELADSQTRDFL